MPRKIKDKIEFKVFEEDNKIVVLARITAQTAKEPSRKRQFVGLPEVEQYLKEQGKSFGRVLENPGYITADIGHYSQYIFEKMKLNNKEQDELISKKIEKKSKENGSLQKDSKVESD